VYDYSQPINPTAPPPAQSVTDQAVSLFDQARDAFKAGNYTIAVLVFPSMYTLTDIYSI
jgi:hypothetical protein